MIVWVRGIGFFAVGEHLLNSSQCLLTGALKVFYESTFIKEYSIILLKVNKILNLSMLPRKNCTISCSAHLKDLCSRPLNYLQWEVDVL